MRIAERIIQFMHSRAERHTLKRVQVGLIYSAVELDNRSTGVAYTFSKQGHCGAINLPKPLAGRKASELVPFLAGSDLVLSSLALATVNALLSANPLPPEAETGDILEMLNIYKSDRVCMVGAFLPLMQALREKQVSIVAVDEVPKPGSNPAEEVEKYLPRSQVAIITATSIINSTIDHLLQLSGSCREVAILGPSTPLLRESFVDTPVTCLSGIRILDTERVMQIIGEGGGFREFKSYCRKVNVRVIEK